MRTERQWQELDNGRFVLQERSQHKPFDSPPSAGFAWGDWHDIPVISKKGKKINGTIQVGKRCLFGRKGRRIT